MWTGLSSLQIFTMKKINRSINKIKKCLLFLFSFFQCVPSNAENQGGDGMWFHCLVFLSHRPGQNHFSISETTRVDFLLALVAVTAFF
jgi:hypothetical protein